MNNLVYPLLMGLALGKRKNLTRQESAKAAMLSYAGSSVGGTAGTLLGTMSAVNAEALQNDLEQCSAEKSRTQTELAAANKDLKALLSKYSVDNNTLSIPITDEIIEILKRDHEQKRTAGANGSDSPTANQVGDMVKAGVNAVIEVLPNALEKIQDIIEKLQSEGKLGTVSTDRDTSLNNGTNGTVDGKTANTANTNTGTTNQTKTPENTANTSSGTPEAKAGSDTNKAPK